MRAEIVPELPPVAFDAARILQVLCNLLSNALKFTLAQGSIVVRLDHVDDDVVCCVSDTGEGIPEEKLQAVFDRFVQVKKNDRRGVGLGLFISKCIVQGHGGRQNKLLLFAQHHHRIDTGGAAGGHDSGDRGDPEHRHRTECHETRIRGRCAGQ